MRPETSADPLGVDRAAVERWLCSEAPDVMAPLSFELLAGGYSNLTYRVVDGLGRSLVLRRPPTGPIRPGAHSMEREWRILTALQGSAVPVPSTVGFCADPDVIGAEFYVMNHVDGIVVDSAEDAVALTNVARQRLSYELVSTMAQLHQVDPSVVGSVARARPESYVSRQLELWMRQVTGECAVRTPEIVEVHASLRARMPSQRWTTLTHGDFRLGNMLVTEAGEIEAVLDWELWTVGDPLADLGWLAAWWTASTDDAWAPADAGGFRSVAELAAEYQRLTGRDTSDLPYYVGFALWRLACISEGVYQRYASGRMGNPRTPLDELAAKPRRLAEAARAALG